MNESRWLTREKDDKYDDEECRGEGEGKKLTKTKLCSGF